MFQKIITISMLVAMSSTLSLSAFAQEEVVKPDEIRKVLKSVKEKDPTKASLKSLTKKSKDISNSDQGDLKIDVDSKVKKIKIKHSKKGNITVGMPTNVETQEGQTIDDQTIFTSKNNKADVIVQAVDGGIRQVINIKSSDAPSFYDFPVELANDEKLNLNEDGSASVTRLYTEEEKLKLSLKTPDGVKIPETTIKLSINKPWAVDANQKDIKTWYTIEDGNKLRQNIDFVGAIFPIKADPTWCGDFFYKVYWEDRVPEGGWSLRNFPTWCGRNSGNNNSGWYEIIDKAPANNAWPAPMRGSNTTSYKSMYNQAICHFALASLWKESYNLEPNKPVVPWSQMINQFDSRNYSACNPK